MKKILLMVGCAAAMSAGAEVYPYGVHAEVTRGEEGEPRFTQTLNAMELAGIGWARSDFDEHRVRRSDGTYDFTSYDRLVDRLGKRGVTLLPIIYGLNGPNPPKTEKECAEHRDYVRAVVAHFGGKMPVVEIWNEANHNFFMKGADPAEYARMLKISYDAVKSVDPSIRVAFTGTAGVPFGWIRKVLESGAANSFDVMNVHPYSWPDMPEGKLDVELEKLGALLKEFGRGDARVWITEHGWPTHQIKDVPNMHVFLAGLKVARPNQKTWNIVLADNRSEGEVSQMTAQAVLDILPVGSKVKACSQKETCERLASGEVDAVMYPSNETFPADTIDAVNEFIRKGGVFINIAGAPCYYGKRDGLEVPGLQDGAAQGRFPFGFRAWWLKHLGEFPKKVNLNATQAGLDAGVKQDPIGFPIQYFLAPDNIGEESEWIPLIAGKSDKGADLVGAAVVRYKGERKGAAVLCTISVKSGASLTSTEEDQARYIARSLGIVFAEGTEAYFPYCLRAFERDPFYSEDHFGLMHANFQPKPAFAAYANFTRERPAGSVQKAGVWHNEKRTFYHPQWTRPDGVKSGMLWTTGADVERTIRFTGGTPTFRNMFGRKIAVREVEKGVCKLKLTGSPIYFSGAELTDVIGR